MLKKALLPLIGATAFAAAVPPAQAHDAAGKERLQVLQEQHLPDAAGRTGHMLTVTFAPGQASVPHVHPGSVFAFVLEGEVESQMEGEQPVRYKAGQSWYEAPNHPHILARNTSKSKPAKLLVWLLTADGEAPVSPLKK